MAPHTPEPELTALRAEYEALEVQSPELIKLLDDVAGGSGPHPQAGPRGARPRP